MQAGRTPLHHAVASGHSECVEALLAEGAAKDAKDTRDGASPLLLAARSAQLECLKALLAHGADAEATSADGSVALHHAAAKGRVEFVNALLAAGANASATDDVRARDSPLLPLPLFFPSCVEFFFFFVTTTPSIRGTVPPPSLSYSSFCMYVFCRLSLLVALLPFLPFSSPILRRRSTPRSISPRASGTWRQCGASLRRARTRTCRTCARLAPRSLVAS